MNHPETCQGAHQQRDTSAYPRSSVTPDSVAWQVAQQPREATVDSPANRLPLTGFGTSSSVHIARRKAWAERFRRGVPSLRHRLSPVRHRGSWTYGCAGPSKFRPQPLGLEQPAAISCHPLDVNLRLIQPSQPPVQRPGTSNQLRRAGCCPSGGRRACLGPRFAAPTAPPPSRVRRLHLCRLDYADPGSHLR